MSILCLVSCFFPFLSFTLLVSVSTPTGLSPGPWPLELFCLWATFDCWDASSIFPLSLHHCHFYTYRATPDHALETIFAWSYLTAHPPALPGQAPVMKLLYRSILRQARFSHLTHNQRKRSARPGQISKAKNQYESSRHHVSYQTHLSYRCIL